MNQEITPTNKKITTINKEISPPNNMLQNLDSHPQDPLPSRNPSISLNEVLQNPKSLSKLKQTAKTKRELRSWRPENKEQLRIFKNIEHIMKNLKENDSSHHCVKEINTSIPLSTEGGQVFEFRHRSKCIEMKNENLCDDLSLCLESVSFQTPSTEFDFVFHPLNQLQ